MKRIARQSLTHATFKPWRDVFGLDPKMAVLEVVDRITMYVYVHVLLEDERLSIAAHMKMGDARKSAPVRVEVGDLLVSSSQLKDSVRLVFASPLSSIR